MRTFTLAAVLTLTSVRMWAGTEYPCDPNPQPDKESKILQALAIEAIKQAGGLVSGNAVKIGETVDALGTQPITEYATHENPQALQKGLESFIKGAGEIAFPELGLIIKGSDALTAGGKIATEKLYDEGERQQYEATIMGGGSDSPLSIIGNLYAEAPFITSGPVVNRGITSSNFGAKIHSEDELRALWFSQYGNFLKGGGLGLSDNMKREVDEQLRAGYPTLLKYWKVERAAVVLRQLRVKYADLVQRAVAEKKACDDLIKLQPPSECGVGKSWNEEESGYRAVWTRQGDTDFFGAVYTAPDGHKETTRNRVTVQGAQVTIARLSSTDTQLCQYTGTISSTAIAGTYKCPQAWQGQRPWTATIKCQ